MSWEWTGGSQVGEDALSEGVLRAAQEAGPLAAARPVPWSHYQNVVTSSYSYAWWGGASKDLQRRETCHEIPDSASGQMRPHRPTHHGFPHSSAPLAACV